MSRQLMRIEFVKRADGAGFLRCTRADGSVTWQKQAERHAAHFIHHDLTHFALETTLQYRHGFFGLIAAGWDIEDTTGKGSRGALPDEAREVEALVGLLDRERGSGALWTTEEFLHFAPQKGVRKLDEETLRRVRACRADLFERWGKVEVGGRLELEYLG